MGGVLKEDTKLKQQTVLAELFILADITHDGDQKATRAYLQHNLGVCAETVHRWRNQVTFSGGKTARPQGKIQEAAVLLVKEMREDLIKRNLGLPPRDFSEILAERPAQIVEAPPSESVSLTAVKALTAQLDGSEIIQALQHVAKRIG